MRTVFYVTDEALSCYRPGQNECRVFLWQESQRIKAFIATLSLKTQVAIVIDLMDEEISFEWLPEVFPWEKSSITQRRQARIHRSDLVLAEVRWMRAKRQAAVGVKKGVKEGLLSTSVVESLQLNTILEWLEKAQLQLKAIYTKPLLLQAYLNSQVKAHFNLSRQALKAPLLLVTRQTKSHFRQLFFYKGELRLSRLVEVDKFRSANVTELESALYPEACLALVHEIQLVLTYVNTQKIVPSKHSIGFIFIDDVTESLKSVLEKSLKDALEDSLNKDASASIEKPLEKTMEDSRKQFLFRKEKTRTPLFITTSFQSISPKTGWACEGKTETSLHAMVDFITNYWPKGFYSTPYIQKIRRFGQVRKGLITVNALLFLAGLYFLLTLGVNSLVGSQKQILLDAKVAQHQVEIKRLEALVQGQGNALFMEATVEFTNSILQRQAKDMVNVDVKRLSRVIARHPNIQLSELQWKTLKEFDGQQHQLSLSAWVFPFYGAYQEPVAWVDAFIEELSTLERVESVTLQKAPFNKMSDQNLALDVKVGEVKALPFSLQIRLNHDTP